MKEERKGWTWRDLGNDNGYWVKIEEKGRLNHKLPFFCPHCSRITGTIDDECLLENRFL